jgi:hypothetical protein
MKKLLPAIIALSFLATACGASNEEKVTEQEAAETQVDQIIDQLEESGPEAIDSNVIEGEDHGHEAESHEAESH